MAFIESLNEKARRPSPQCFPLLCLLCVSLFAAIPGLGKDSIMMPVAFEDILALRQPPADAEIAYGEEPSQFGRLWLPAYAAGKPAPVVVLLHGGCWLQAYAIDHIQALAGALARNGYAVWALEYRRVGEPGAGWPGTFRDVARGVDYLRDLGDERLDLQRVLIAGHSAGGHLALWVAARAGFSSGHPLYSAEPLSLRGAIGLAAITDLVAYAQEKGSCPRALQQLMDGGPRDRPVSYGLASPASLPTTLPTVLIQGVADPIVPMRQARALPAARIRKLRGAGHFDLIHPQTPAFAIFLEEIESLLAP
jgi:acetyl esterase/lipase